MFFYINVLFVICIFCLWLSVDNNCKRLVEIGFVFGVKLCDCLEVIFLNICKYCKGRKDKCGG